MFNTQPCEGCLWVDVCDKDPQFYPCEHYVLNTVEINGYEDDLDARQEDYQDVVNEYN